MKCGSGSTTTSVSTDNNVNVNAPHQIWRLDKMVNNLGFFFILGVNAPLVPIFYIFFFYILVPTFLFHHF